jgi:hypothetical protein
MNATIQNYSNIEATVSIMDEIPKLTLLRVLELNSTECTVISVLVHPHVVHPDFGLTIYVVRTDANKQAIGRSITRLGVKRPP